MVESKITFDVRATGPDLCLAVFLDDQLLQELEPGEHPQRVTVTLDDDIDSQHVLSLRMTGKLPFHTKIDGENNIIEDRVIEILDVKIDDIVLGHTFVKSAKYTHDFNGTADTVTDQFNGGIMGCNGQVDFAFSTPVYLWLLEHI